MERETKTIELSNGEQIKILTYLTWGEKQQIDDSVLRGAKIGNAGISGYDTAAVLEGKYKLLEICVKEISKNGEIKQFSREWMNALSIDDGELLYNTLDEMTKKKGLMNEK